MNLMNRPPTISFADDAADSSRAGFRLHRLELLNWGTFDGRVWALDLHGANVLVTGDIGSGKSTLVDAVSTLLVAPQKLAYNKAAGAEARERNARSYLLGHFKAERGETGHTARPVALRGVNSFSVLLARFRNDDLDQDVTLAQVFWLKDTQGGPPARLYVLADKGLSIAGDFTDFGADIGKLRKRLRKNPATELHDSFPPYAAGFRRRFGIESEQALDLFNQTVSMKSVGNLTDFVRLHTLEEFPAQPRIDALLTHFDDLDRAHESVLKAKRQIERLTPLIADCERLAALSTLSEQFRECRDALRPWFAGIKGDLLGQRIAGLDAELIRLQRRIGQLDSRRRDLHAAAEDIRRAIAENGGDRLAQLDRTIAEKTDRKQERAARAATYARLADEAGLPAADDVDAFLVNLRSVGQIRNLIEGRQAQAQNAITEASVDLSALKNNHGEVSAEIASLRNRRSNIPRRMLDLRDALCRQLNIEEDALPFAGELIEFRTGQSAWEGAIERVLHGFGLSLLVADNHYADVAAWVDRTDLGARLVYLRVRPQARRDTATGAASLLRKITIKPDSTFHDWLDAELARRFDYTCCDTLDQFRREQRAITRAGQIKDPGERHVKDDRHPLNDRSRFILGWSNHSKIAALEKIARDLEIRMQASAAAIAKQQKINREQQDKLGTLRQIALFEQFSEVDWRPIAVEIEQLETERRELAEGSDRLQVLAGQLAATLENLDGVDKDLGKANGEYGKVDDRRATARSQLAEARAQRDAADAAVVDTVFPRIEVLRGEFFDAGHVPTIESCDNRERDMRGWLQDKIDAEQRKISRLQQNIVAAMASYNETYPLDTREIDATVEAEGAYREALRQLQADDLPRFETRFKELLNENTIREIANFQSQLNRERQTIRERIQLINGSLHGIDYNPARYILLEADPTIDAEIRDFQQDLRACTEGSFTGAGDADYSEAKFLQVKRIVERFRGREGTAELDRRWTRKVTDVRNWFSFSASERWREDDKEHEHYTDSGGKSGGQKEKLAYTVLAASLAYQFGLEWGASRVRSFRFVVVDEAFGRGSDESARYGLQLFGRLGLQMLVVTPLQKIHVIEPYVAGVGFVHNPDGRRSMLRNLTIEEYRAERTARGQ